MLILWGFQGGITREIVYFIKKVFLMSSFYVDFFEDLSFENEKEKKW